MNKFLVFLLASTLMIDTAIALDVQASVSVLSTTALIVNVNAEIDPIVRGNSQTIITEVTDGTDPIEGALVTVSVTYASGTKNEWCSDLTNSSGISVCTHTIGGSSTPGIFTVNSTATKENYAPGIGYTTFNVITATTT